MDDKQLREILDKHRDWVYGRKGGVRADLTRANLYGADLYGANLTRADLTRANLYGADLYGANLTRADLTRADLTGANLTGANLTGADLTGANLTGANLTGANLYGADLYGANLTRADLTRADLTRANLTGANLTGANLTGADLTGANLTGANLTGANLYGADLKKTILDGINWLAYIGIVPDHQGTARAYKVLTKDGVGPFNGSINYLEKGAFESALDPDANIQCSQGIHLANLRWCLDNKEAGRRLFMFSFNVKDCVCPVGSDGKFRVSKCRKIGECDWKGNLLE